jgi:uncharacterized protein YdaU (DUF1376 family)
MRIPYIALYPADVIADTYHLGNTELGIYWRLLLHYYQHRRPLPFDLDKVCRIAYASSPEERKAVEFVLTEFFTLATDAEGHKVWEHHRADREIAEARARHESAVGKAKKAAEARWGKQENSSDNAPGNAQAYAQAYAQALPEQCQPEPEREREEDKDLDQRESSELDLLERRASQPYPSLCTTPPPPSLSLSQKTSIDKKGEIPEEGIEWAIRERPDLTREHITRVMARRFEIHYQGIPLTPKERAKKWMEWVVAENRNGTNGQPLICTRPARDQRQRHCAHPGCSLPGSIKTTADWFCAAHWQ